MNNNKTRYKHYEKTTNKKKHRVISFIFPIISLIIIIACVSYIVTWTNQNNENEQTIKEIYADVVSVDEETGDSKIDFEKLKQRNEDVVGWLKVNNTNINYPVVQSNNNDFYLRHNFDKKYNIAGWIFADYRAKFDGKDKNIIIYGHNMKNGSMFSTLNTALTKKWYENEDNMNITFETEKQVATYKIFSIYKIKKETFYTTTSFETTESYKKFLDEIKSRSIKDFGEDVNEEDKILTLSTCAGNNSYRVVIHAYLCDTNK